MDAGRTWEEDQIIPISPQGLIHFSSLHCALGRLETLVYESDIPTHFNFPSLCSLRSPCPSISCCWTPKPTERPWLLSLWPSVYGASSEAECPCSSTRPAVDPLNMVYWCYATKGTQGLWDSKVQHCENTALCWGLWVNDSSFFLLLGNHVAYRSSCSCCHYIRRSPLSSISCETWLNF